MRFRTGCQSPPGPFHPPHQCFSCPPRIVSSHAVGKTFLSLTLCQSAFAASVQMLTSTGCFFPRSCLPGTFNRPLVTSLAGGKPWCSESHHRACHQHCRAVPPPAPHAGAHQPLLHISTCSLMLNFVSESCFHWHVRILPLLPVISRARTR